MIPEDVLTWVAARMQEPSTYAGLAPLLLALHVSTDPGLMHSIALIGCGLGGVLAFALKEGSAFERWRATSQKKDQ